VPCTQCSKISLRNGQCHRHHLWWWWPSKSNMYPNWGISKCYLCLLVHIECDKITLITLPLLQQEFSDITCEIFNLAFTLATFQACTSWYKLRKVFCRFADSFIMTINKSQGQSVKNVGLHPPKSVFTHGQLYVVLSQCTSSQHIKVLCKEGTQETDLKYCLSRGSHLI